MSNQPRDELDDAIEQVEDQARAEGFAAGLFFGSTVAFEMGMMSPLAGMFTDLDAESADSGANSSGDESDTLESLYPEVEDDLFDGTQDVAVEEMVEELESLEGEGIEATMFEPMDGYGADSGESASSSAESASADEDEGDDVPRGE